MTNTYTFTYFDGIDLKEIDITTTNRTHAMQLFSDKFCDKKTKQWRVQLLRIYVNNEEKGKFVIAIGEKGKKTLKTCNATEAFNELSTIIGCVPPKITEFLGSASIGQVLTDNQIKIYCVRYYKDVKG